MFEKYTSLVSKTIFNSISDVEVHTCYGNMTGHIAQFLIKVALSHCMLHCSNWSVQFLISVGDQLETGCVAIFLMIQSGCIASHLV